MPAPKLAHIRHFQKEISDGPRLSHCLADIIESYSPNGISRDDLHERVARWAVLDLDQIGYFLQSSDLVESVTDALEALKTDDLIAYHRGRRVWYYKGSRALSVKEEAYFRAKGFSPGWRRISNPTRVIAWIHKTLTPLQFENFCMSLLSEHCQADARLTEKHPVTGADGGFDGIGEMDLGDARGCVPFGVQVKRYALHRQIGYLDCERFGGKSFRHGLRHGFIITTGTFNDDATRCIDDYAGQGLEIELIDQTRLITIMAQRNDEPHGYGLHTSRFTGREGTEVVLHYVNENDILRAAGASPVSA